MSPPHVPIGSASDVHLVGCQQEWRKPLPIDPFVRGSGDARVVQVVEIIDDHHATWSEPLLRKCQISLDTFIGVIPIDVY